jgi:chromosome segregation ATPase
MEALRNQARRDKANADAEREELISQFQDKEARLLQATSEESQNQTLYLEQEFNAKIQTLEETLSKERVEMKDEIEEYKRLLRESHAKLDQAESQLQATIKRFEKDTAQSQQREERAVRKADDRLAQTMALLDERNEEVSHLKTIIRDMESKVNEHEEGVEEAEEELDELQHENDSLRATIEKLEKESKRLKDKVATLESNSENLIGLQMELTMVKEDLARERTKNQSVVDSAISTHTQVESERDAALSELRDVKQQLAATLGDLEVARADNTRLMTANSNLQGALEAFQDERQAEMRMIDEQRMESEEAIKSAHEAAMSAIRQTHEVQIHEVQKAADATVKKAMYEIELLEGNIAKLKSDNNQLRRSLDEAIHRLQSTQEDIIDRNVMKNILLDWCMLKDKTTRHQVLEVMANLLHFTDEEKEKVHLTTVDLDSVRARFVGALAAPLPPSKADVEHLEGDNVREKWINFLLAETDDG